MSTETALLQTAMRATVRIVSVPSARAEELRRVLQADGLIDRTHRMTKHAGRVLMPLTGEPVADLSEYGAVLLETEDLESRPSPRNPVEQLRQRLGELQVPWDAVPKKWERIGDVVVLRIPPAGRVDEMKIARAFAEVLHAGTVLEDLSGVHGILRAPSMRVLYGSRTETVHLEGGVRYKLDVTQVMFSSGNLPERVSVARLVRPGDVVVDLFAGIGYFSLPIAVHSKAAEVHACELNPVSFRYLMENLRLNRVTNVVPHLGDCRSVAPRGVADVVLMGHFSAREHLDVAFECLRGAGIVVYHELTPREQFPGEPVRRVMEAARTRWYDIESARTRIVKSYAPGIVHAIVEARVRRRPKGISGSRTWDAR